MEDLGVTQFIAPRLRQEVGARLQFSFASMRHRYTTTSNKFLPFTWSGKKEYFYIPKLNTFKLTALRSELPKKDKLGPPFLSAERIFDFLGQHHSELNIIIISAVLKILRTYFINNCLKTSTVPHFWKI